MSTLPEERLLKPLDPIPVDVNEWPDFALRQVKIFYQGKGRYADLLEASTETPLCVLGELMPLDEEQEELAISQVPSDARIKIENVTNYSFGQDDNGRPVIWAAGKAGWYEISPSERYIQHYNNTIEAIDLFYFMVDQHKKLPKKRQRTGFLIDPFLAAYQKHTDYQIDDDDEAMETIHKHHKFILKQMIEEREEIDWSETHLLKHLAETYGEEINRLKAARVRHPTNAMVSESDSVSESASESEIEGEVESESEADSSSDVSASEVQEQVLQRSSTVESTSNSEESDEESETASDTDTRTEEDVELEDSVDWTRPIWDLLNFLRKQIAFDMRNCSIDQLATEIEKCAWFPGSHKAAVSAVERSAEPLVRLMNEARLRKKFNWSTRNIYDELEATLASEIAATILKTPAGKAGKQRHRMKSVLRPSGATKSNKRARGKDNAGDDDDEEMADVTDSLPAVKRDNVSPRNVKAWSVDSTTSREDSPSRQLNGHYDPYALPELPPGPEAQEMLDLIAKEAKRVGRQNQTSHLEAFLGQHLI